MNLISRLHNVYAALISFSNNCPFNILGLIFKEILNFHSNLSKFLSHFKQELRILTKLNLRVINLNQLGLCVFLICKQSKLVIGKGSDFTLLISLIVQERVRTSCLIRTCKGFTQANCNFNQNFIRVLCYGVLSVNHKGKIRVDLLLN